MTMYAYVVGHAYPEWVGQPDASRVAFGASGLAVTVMLEDPTMDEESQHMTPNPIHVRFTVLSPHLGFWMFKFGTLPWADAPYSPGILPTRPPLPHIGDGQGLSVHMTLVDTRTGILRYQRLFSLGTSLSQYFVDWAAACPDWTRDQYNQAIDTAYEAYTTTQLADNAVPAARYTLA